MQGARFVETNLVQKMLQQKSYDQHMKKIQQIRNQKATERKVSDYTLTNHDVLAKTQNIKAKSSRYWKQEQQRLIYEQDHHLRTHIVEINEGKNSQFRTIWTVSDGTRKADTSISTDNLPKRLHSPYRRKMLNKIEEENYLMQQRIDQTKQLVLDKQAEQIKNYEKLRNHMTRIKSNKTLTQQSKFPTLNKTQTEKTVGQFLNFSKIDRVE